MQLKKKCVPPVTYNTNWNNREALKFWLKRKFWFQSFTLVRRVAEWANLCNIVWQNPINSVFINGCQHSREVKYLSSLVCGPASNTRGAASISKWRRKTRPGDNNSRFFQMIILITSLVLPAASIHLQIFPPIPAGTKRCNVNQVSPSTTH